MYLTTTFPPRYKTGQKQQGWFSSFFDGIASTFKNVKLALGDWQMMGILVKDSNLSNQLMHYERTSLTWSYSKKSHVLNILLRL